MNLRSKLLIALSALLLVGGVGYLVWFYAKPPIRPSGRWKSTGNYVAPRPPVTSTAQAPVAVPPTPDPLAGWSSSTRQAFALLPTYASTTPLAFDLGAGRYVFQLIPGERNENRDTWIWYVDHSLKHLVATGTVGDCSGISAATTTEGFSIQDFDSPCEAGSSSHVEYYSAAGKKLGYSDEVQPGSNFSFVWSGKKYDVGLAFKSSVCGDLNKEVPFDETKVGHVTTTYIGAEINGRIYRAPRPRQLLCSGTYGSGSSIDPTAYVSYLGSGRFRIYLQSDAVEIPVFTVDPNDPTLIKFE